MLAGGSVGQQVLRMSTVSLLRRLQICDAQHLFRGFYLAKAKGWYKDAGLDVTFRSPHVDAYKSTPASHVADKTADFAMTPTER